MGKLVVRINKKHKKRLAFNVHLVRLPILKEKAMFFIKELDSAGTRDFRLIIVCGP